MSITEIQRARSLQDWAAPQHKAAAQEKGSNSHLGKRAGPIRSNVSYQMQLYQVESNIYSVLTIFEKGTGNSLSNGR